MLGALGLRTGEAGSSPVSQQLPRPKGYPSPPGRSANPECKLGPPLGLCNCGGQEPGIRFFCWPILQARHASPTIGSGFVKNAGATTYCSCMSVFDVVYGQADLHASCRLAPLRDRGRSAPFSPGDLCMDPADPTIVDRIVTRMEIKAESVTVQGHRPL